jgi:hypothetical protein
MQVATLRTRRFDWAGAFVTDKQKNNSISYFGSGIKLLLELLDALGKPRNLPHMGSAGYVARCMQTRRTSALLSSCALVISWLSVVS